MLGIAGYDRSPATAELCSPDAEALKCLSKVSNEQQRATKVGEGGRRRGRGERGGGLAHCPLHRMTE